MMCHQLCHHQCRVRENRKNGLPLRMTDERQTRGRRGADKGQTSGTEGEKGEGNKGAAPGKIEISQAILSRTDVHRKEQGHGYSGAATKQQRRPTASSGKNDEINKYARARESSCIGRYARQILLNDHSFSFF